MRNIRLHLCYDGTRYRGWQRLPGEENTIQSKIEHALSRILEEPIEISGSGRTDAGVHAKGQIANFHCESALSTEEIMAQLRKYLPEDIGVISCSEAAARFHARLNAREKTYCYRIWNSDVPCVFERRYVFRLPEELNVSAMKEAAQHFLGEHDFSAFCGNPKMKKSTVRCIKSIRIEQQGHELRLYFTGDGFLHHMVRILTGTLIEVGRGTRDAASIPGLIGAKRSEAGFLVPAQGLCLEEVFY